ncbi:Conserved transmembrane protein [Methanosarcina vacuolata Z-761]|uniref:Conserved transmembrane protein n=1 Tax=Methanosarcina vacuolata Z-761 TaxID=1434123 RepID=A0A0E3Q6F0_9EURY|nr:Conserved transmembrane protein [Methanosarcina vacuolata Z-761]
MQTLVICIDRDNDLGEKAKLETPIVGREANVQAAVALGIADPEDSDTNTIFGGIRILDELRAKGTDASSSE